jgi:type VI secretion system secreted protein VgrG
MSQQGLRFTLDVDGLLAMSTAVVRFTLCQNLSTPFTLSVDIASGLPDLNAEDFLEKNATLTVWQGMVYSAASAVSSPAWNSVKTTTGR